MLTCYQQPFGSIVVGVIPTQRNSCGITANQQIANFYVLVSLMVIILILGPNSFTFVYWKQLQIPKYLKRIMAIKWYQQQYKTKVYVKRLNHQLAKQHIFIFFSKPNKINQQKNTLESRKMDLNKMGRRFWKRYRIRWCVNAKQSVFRDFEHAQYSEVPGSLQLHLVIGPLGAIAENVMQTGPQKETV